MTTYTLCFVLDPVLHSCIQLSAGDPSGNCSLHISDGMISLDDRIGMMLLRWNMFCGNIIHCGSLVKKERLLLSDSIRWSPSTFWGQDAHDCADAHTATERRTKALALSCIVILVATCNHLPLCFYTFEPMLCFCKSI